MMESSLIKSLIGRKWSCWDRNGVKKLFGITKLKNSKNSLIEDVYELENLKSSIKKEIEENKKTLTNLKTESEKFRKETKTNKDILNFYSNYSNQFLNKEIERELLCIKGMTGYEYEEYIANLLSYSYFDRIEVTKFSGDHGVDIIAYHGEEKIGFQCKRSKSPVSNTAVQEVYTGLKMYEASYGIVITNNTYTKSAYEIAKITNTLLWDENDLKKLIKQYLLEEKFALPQEILKLEKTELLNLINFNTVESNLINPLDEIFVKDELFESAKKLVLETQTASISMLQRKFRIGYNRAARIMDQLEYNMIVGPSEGSAPRQVFLE